ncbi:MAG: polar amino acid transport system substrate-binding protein [Acetobacteraceae bacterium]|jgi:polar amino acid transport system substrate-binding protein|nr:transporter substrate-binding protein [Rhodopila sp.]MEA2730518.1 polar amino acid transport system substrate-binding protein [Acetobacteraceae bacterium]MEA2769398.1 polar amino acid transport system substrate-binding protein [Acetobacteraceae bacterium]
MMLRRDLACALAAFAVAVPEARGESAAESTFERIRRTHVVRVGAVGGQAPYCVRDLASGEWRGFIPSYGRDLAKALDAEAEFVESTWGNAVLDLQADKVDIFFGLNPTPRRALAIDFTHPLFNNLFTLIARPGFRPSTWEELNDPSVRIALEIGTSYDQVMSETCPRATFLRLKTNNDASLAVQAGKADCQVLVALLALSVLKRDPAVGTLVVPRPLFTATTNAGLRREPDKTWRDFVDNWIDWNRGLGRMRRMVVDSLGLVGIAEADIPPEVSF